MIFLGLFLNDFRMIFLWLGCPEAYLFPFLEEVVTKKQHNNCIDPTAYVRFTRPFNLFVPKALVGSRLWRLQATGNWGKGLGIGNPGLFTDHWPCQVQHKTLKRVFQLLVFCIYSPKKEALKFHHLYLQPNFEPRAFRSLGPRSEAITDQGANLSFSDVANI